MRERGYLTRRLNCEHVGEYEYRPGKCRETYRMVVVRNNISRMRGENAPDRRAPVLLLHHHPEGHQRGRGRPPGQRPATTRRTWWAQLKSGGSARCGLGPYMVDGGAGMEPEELVRPDDALQGGPKEVRRHGVQDVRPRDDPHTLPGHPPGPGARRCGSSAGSPPSTGCSAPGARSSAPASRNAGHSRSLLIALDRHGAPVSPGAENASGSRTRHPENTAFDPGIRSRNRRSRTCAAT